jgi:hypothetical protein
MQFNFLKTFYENFKELTAEVKKRAEICNVCEFRETGLCKKCGCFLEAKIRIPVAKCPIGKW